MFDERYALIYSVTGWVDRTQLERQKANIICLFSAIETVDDFGQSLLPPYCLSFAEAQMLSSPNAKQCSTFALALEGKG